MAPGVDVRASRALSGNNNQDDESEGEGKGEEEEGEGGDNEQSKELITQPQKAGMSDYERQKQKNISELKVIMNTMKEEMGYATLMEDIRKDVEKKGKGKGKGRWRKKVYLIWSKGSQQDFLKWGKAYTHRVHALSDNPHHVLGVLRLALPSPYLRRLVPPLQLAAPKMNW